MEGDGRDGSQGLCDGEQYRANRAGYLPRNLYTPWRTEEAGAGKPEEWLETSQYPVARDGDIPREHFRSNPTRGYWKCGCVVFLRRLVRTPCSRFRSLQSCSTAVTRIWKWWATASR